MTPGMSDDNTAAQESASEQAEGQDPSGSEVVDEIKRQTDELISYIYANCPINRQRTVALTNYEQAAMWAVKSNFV